MSENITFNSSYLAQLELLRLESRRKFLGSRQGGHLSIKKGHGLEFSDYRQYELGDNPRYIDWKAYGRTDRLYVKRFQEEQDLLVSVFLDASASMGAETDPQKWDFARRLALSLSYIGLMQQDKVGLSLMGQGASITLSGPKAFPHFVKKLSEIPSIPPISFGAALRLAAINIKFPGIAIVISDFLCPFEEIDAGFRQLRSRNLDIVALQVIGVRDLAPLNLNEFSQMIDAETGERFDLEFDQDRSNELKSMLEAHTQRCSEYFRQRQIGFVCMQSDQDIVASLRASSHALRVIR